LAQTLLEVPKAQTARPIFQGNFDSLLHQRRRRVIRSQDTIVAAILEACRTPTVQHWIMVKARLGYDTFWKHMNSLISHGMMNAVNDGHRTLYSVNEKGLNLLQELTQ
jgi:predicted transcriptional regulator